MKYSIKPQSKPTGHVLLATVLWLGGLLTGTVLGGVVALGMVAMTTPRLVQDSPAVRADYMVLHQPKLNGVALAPGYGQRTVSPLYPALNEYYTGPALQVR